MNLRTLLRNLDDGRSYTSGSCRVTIRDESGTEFEIDKIKVRGMGANGRLILDMGEKVIPDE